jgi:hypothetical protein
VEVTTDLPQVTDKLDQTEIFFASSLETEHKIDYPRFLVGFVLLDLQFDMYVLLIVVCPFVLFLLAIVLSVLLLFTDSDYPFGISKLFLH